MEWNCGTNMRGHLVDGVPSDALRVFQTTCHHRYRSPQIENGLPSITCWHGVYCVLIELVTNCLWQMFPSVCTNGFGTWTIPKLGHKDGLGVFPCGASFSTTPPTSMAFSRRVDLVCLPDGIRLPSESNRKTLLTPNDVPIYDAKRFHLIPMQDLVQEPLFDTPPNLPRLMA